MPTTIESLELEVQSNSTSAIDGIDALSSSLTKLRNAVKGGIGLTSVVNQLRDINTASRSVGNSSYNIDKLANSLLKLKGLGGVKISSSIGNQIRNIGSAASSLNGADFTGIGKMASALQPLSSVGEATGLKSVITQLKKLPGLAQTLNTINWDTLASQLQRLANALTPLANRLNVVSAAFSRLPASVSQVVTATNRIEQANNRASTSYADLWAHSRMAFNAIRTGTRAIASWITESNRYVEDLNLFTASLGDYATEAKDYAEKVADVMGIDPAEWLRNQGIFNTIIEGFGVASDKALIMSKNLTQLGYDLSSYANMSFTEAMTKLTSGISGELEPLRRLGYDLSVARLQQEALNLGITKSVNAMTQAEKSQLRYHAIMTQVTVAQGDMSRTLNAPANQIRILRAQITQCARALGNIFIPALNAVLPYCIAFVKVLRTLADNIASLVGFQLPEVDYSNMKETIGVGEELGDSFDKANTSAKKFKRTVMGFDELNLLKGDDDSSLGDALDGLGGGFDIDLPEYDFLDNMVATRVDEIVKKLKEWLGLTEDIDTWSEFFHTKLGKILTTVGAIGLGLAAWKISGGVLNALKLLSGLFKAGGLTKALTIPIGIGLLVTGVTLEWTSIIDTIKNELDGDNFVKIISGSLFTVGAGAFLGKGLASWITTAFGGSAIAKALTTATTNLGLGSATAAGSALAAGVGAVIAGIPAYITGIWDALKNGLNWLNGLLIPFGSTLSMAGVGAIVGACGGPLTAGIGALIGLAIGLITDGIIAIREHWDEISAWFTEKWETFNAWIQNIPTKIREVITAVGEWFYTKWESFSTWLQNIPTRIREVVDAVGNWFEKLPERIGYAIGHALGTIAGWVKNVYKFFTVDVPNAIKSVWDWFGKLPERIGQVLSHACNTVAGWAKNVYKFFTVDVPKAIETVGQWFASLPTRIYTGLYNALISVRDWVKGMWTTITTEIPKIVNKVVGFFKELPVKLKNLGKDIWNGLLNGLRESWHNVTKAISGYCSGFVNGFKDALGIHSPSTVMESIAGYTVAGFQIGLRGIGSVFTNAYQTVENGASAFGDNMFSWGSNMMSQLASGIEDNEYKVQKAVSRLTGDMSLDSSISANVSAYGTTASAVAEDNSAGLVSAVYDAVTSALATTDGDDSGTPIIINLGNEQIASFLVKQNKRIALMSGGRA